MSITRRLASLERQFGDADRPCPDHANTAIVFDDEPRPADADIPPCPRCGRRGNVLRITEIVVDGQGNPCPPNPPM